LILLPFMTTIDAVIHRRAITTIISNTTTNDNRKFKFNKLT